MTDTVTPFDYLLNAFEEATRADYPSRLGYAEKRRALYAYVRGLESVAASSSPPESATTDTQRLDWLLSKQYLTAISATSAEIDVEEVGTFNRPTIREAIDAAMNGDQEFEDDEEPLTTSGRQQHPEPHDPPLNDNSPKRYA